MNHKQIITIIDDNEGLKESIENLVLYCISNNDLNIDVTNLKFDIVPLIKHNIISIESHQLIVDSPILFSFVLLEKFKSSINFLESKDFLKLCKLLSQIDDKFMPSSFSVYSEIKKHLWGTAIEQHYISFEDNFVKYIDELGDSLYDFCEGFCCILPILDIKFDDFLRLSDKITELTYREDITYNIPYSNILVAVKLKTYNDNSFGLGCLKYIVESDKNEYKVLPAIISGLYSVMGFEFYKEHLESLIDDNKFIFEILSGLSNINKIEERECQLFLKLYERFEANDGKVPGALLQLIISILKSDYTEVHCISTCYLKLRSIVLSNNTSLIHHLIHDLTLLKKYNTENIGLLQLIMHQEYFDPNIFLNRILQIFWNLKDTIYLKEIIYTLSDVKPFISLFNFLESAIYSITKSLESESFDLLLIELVTHNEAKYRFTGLDIFNGLSRKNFQFTYDIRTLPSLIQYKLWVSLCQDFREPKYTVPCLLPLLSSDSDIVREAIICKMEEYSENFGEGLITVIKANLDLDIVANRDIVNRIESYMNAYFDKYVVPKKTIKELNPYYTHNNLFTEFNINYTRHFSSQIQKSANQNSFLSLFATTIHLAKGGGWKMEGKSDVNKLGKIGTVCLMN